MRVNSPDNGDGGANYKTKVLMERGEKYQLLARVNLDSQKRNRESEHGRFFGDGKSPRQRAGWPRLTIPKLIEVRKTRGRKRERERFE